MQEAEWFRNKRDIIEQALKDKFGSNDKYIFVKDFSDKEVIYEIESKEGFKTYKVNYTIDDNDVVTFGDPVEVIWINPDNDNTQILFEAEVPA